MVIQRIQSVYLLIASILMGCYSFSDVILVKTINETLEKVSLFDASLIYNKYLSYSIIFGINL